jgi:hypothetical protein
LDDGLISSQRFQGRQDELIPVLHVALKEQSECPDDWRQQGASTTNVKYIFDPAPELLQRTATLSGTICNVVPLHNVHSEYAANDVSDTYAAGPTFTAARCS